MSLTLISRPQRIIGAQGQHYRIVDTIKSDVILTGEVIRVNPAMWLGVDDNSNNVSWQIQYPTTTAVGGIPMAYVGQTVNENYKVNIEPMPVKIELPPL